ncbi:farnesyl pyrophosphate synthase isoform X3 [Vombatus ursinus]|uniref:farnesyl pyrophosphate synthase isoform X3 n=1 Tax=Vombatus ursinus TaxID=29139 RepID=UPI000FFCF5F8|nr:farnesyl pyrophosphate synthase isoform X3 [Vombatus ursinus]
MHSARWLRSAGTLLLPAPRWVPWERQLGPPWQPSVANGGPALGVQHSTHPWCQSRREEPRMNGDQKSVFAQEKQDFVQHFSQVVKILTEDGMGHSEVGDAIARLKEVLVYNALGGKYNRGLSVLMVFRELVEPRKQDADSLQRALAVGWCVELVRLRLQAFFLVADDIMDASLTRRGQPCWYKKSTYQTEIGQTLDLITAPQGKVDLIRFTEQRYKTIVKYKTAFYSFYLPFAAAMFMAGIDGEKEHANAKSILLEMGEFFQIQDDYLDLFGDPSVTGKIGTDIQDNKCSWLVVKCLQLASSEQRKMLEENYGQKDPEKVAKVKELYEKLELPAYFNKFEEESYSRLMGLIEKHSSPLPPSIFLEMAKKIYKRQK